MYFLAGQSNAGSMSNSDVFHAVSSNAVPFTTVISGGTSLAADAAKDDWYPVLDDNPETGELAEQLFEQMRETLQAGNPISGLIWVQGEADKNSDESADNYGANLSAFLDRVIDEFGTGFPIVIVGLSSQTPITGVNATFAQRWETIRAAQQEIADSYETATFLDPDEIASLAEVPTEDMFRDTLHYTYDFAGLLLEESLSATCAVNTMASGDDDETLFLGAGHDNIMMGRGNDTVHAGSGDDQINGGSHNDQIWGGDGVDRLSGSRGHDTLFGGEGDDQMFGNSGADLVLGEAGNDFISGGGGHDTIDGGIGQDTLTGGHGSDLLFGQDGDDLLLGNRGNDTLIGGSGNDTLYGGQGHDTFVFRPNEGNDVLASPRANHAERAGFDTVQDSIQLLGFTTVTTETVMNFVSQGDDGAVFSAENTEITFWQVGADLLSVDNFLF
jgi:Ca2+-binding RTX toxin-like protein